MELRKAELQEVEPCGASRDDPGRFLRELRQLRAGAGLEHVELAARAHYPCDVIRAAENGPTLPSLPVLSAYVRGCGGTPAEWEERWRSLTRSPASPLLPVRSAGESDAAVAGARIGSCTPVPDGHDTGFIMAALSRVADGIAAESSASSAAADAGSAAAGAGALIPDAVPMDAVVPESPLPASSRVSGAASPPDAPLDGTSADSPAQDTAPAAPDASALPRPADSPTVPARPSGSRSLPPRAMLAALIALVLCLAVVLVALFA